MTATALAAPPPPARSMFRTSGAASRFLLGVWLSVMAMDLVRASGPMLDYTFTFGIGAAAATALATYLAPGLVVVLVLRRRSDAAASVGSAVAVSAAAVLILRLAVQLTGGPVRMVLELLAVACVLAALTLWAVWSRAFVAGGALVAGSVACGALFALGEQMALNSLDALWRRDVLGWIAFAVIWLACAIALARFRASRHSDEVGDLAVLGRPGATWSLGLFVALAVSTFANPGFIGAFDRLGVWGLLALMLLGLFGLAVASGRMDLSRLSYAIAAVGFVGGVALMYCAPSVQFVGVALTVLFAPAVLRGALSPKAIPADDAGQVRRLRGTLAGAACALGLASILPILLYQVDYDGPLPVPNYLIPIAAAGFLGLCALRRLPKSAERPDLSLSRPRSLLVLAACTLALAVTGSLVYAPGPSTDATPPPELTVVSWNLHYGVSPEPAASAAEIREAIASYKPDVVLLQEVSRGWIQGGGVDVAAYLGHGLGMNYVYAPAADQWFGNVILSKYPLSDDFNLSLPYGEGPQKRSAVGATSAGVQWVAVHLQHRDENTATRIAQIETLLGKTEAMAGPLVIGGDLNAEPGWAEPTKFLDAGMISAQDQAGDPDALTFSSTDPFQRIDWIFGDQVSFADFHVGTSQASDHLPLVTKVKLPAN